MWYVLKTDNQRVPLVKFYYILYKIPSAVPNIEKFLAMSGMTKGYNLVLNSKNTRGEY